MVPADPDDRELIGRAQRDPEAFGALFDRYYEAIAGYVFRRTLDWELARDLTSNVFLKAFRGLWRYRWTGVPVSSWLYAIATNEIRMHVRKTRRPIASLDDLMDVSGFEVADPTSLAAERAEADRAIERHAAFHRVQRALLTLPLHYQEVLALRFFEEKTVPEIAAILKRREGTIKSLLSRGLARLRTALGPLESQSGPHLGPPRS